MPQKSVPQKLLIKEGPKILFLNSPEDYREKTLGLTPKNSDDTNE